MGNKFIQPPQDDDVFSSTTAPGLLRKNLENSTSSINLINKNLQDCCSLFGSGLFPHPELKALGIGLVIETSPSPTLAVTAKDHVGLIKGNTIGNNKLVASDDQTVNISTPDATDPRIDLIIVRSQTASEEAVAPFINAGSNSKVKGVVEVVTGTPDASPIVPDQPVDSILLAEVAVAAGATSIINANITDKRQFLRLIPELEQFLLNKIAEVGAASGEVLNRNTTNINKIGFKTDARHNASVNNLKDGFLDVFANTGDIDGGLSSFSHDPVLQIVRPPSVSPVPNPQTVGLWNMNEGTGTIINDSSVNSNTGLLSGGANFTTGKFGGGLNFPGAPALADMGTSSLLKFDFNQPFTKSIWYRTSVTPFFDVVFATIAAPIFRGVFIFVRNNVQVGFIFQNQAGILARIRVTAPSSLADGVYHHLVFTHDGSGLASGLDIYIDGILGGSKVILNNSLGGNTTVDPLSPLTIGNRIGGVDGNNFDLDDSMISNRLYSASEVALIFNAPGEFAVGGATAGTVVSLAHTAVDANEKALLTADSTAGVTYEISRDDGTTFTTITPGTIFNFTAEPAGTLMRLKATIPVGDELDNWALDWSV